MITELSVQNFKSWKDTGKLADSSLNRIFRREQFRQNQHSANAADAKADRGASTRLEWCD